jgi:hypothetical protein
MTIEAKYTQVGGNHYTKMAIQPMEYSMLNNLGAAEHTVIKYVSRWKSKGGVEDLRKAAHTLQLLIEFAEKAQPTATKRQEESDG